MVEKRNGVQGLQDRVGRNGLGISGRGERRNEVGFVYDSYGNGRPSNGKYLNGHAGGRNLFNVNNSTL